MNEMQYTAFVKEMCDIHAVASLVTRRRGMEAVYYHHHYKRGIRLRGKYRPQ